MTNTQPQLPAGIDSLPSHKQNHVKTVLRCLYDAPSVLGVLFGGSVSYKQRIVDSDVDLFCLVDSPSTAVGEVISLLRNLPGTDVVVPQGFFPWTGILHTVFFLEDLDFAIDVGMVGVVALPTFFWEPDGTVAFDKTHRIAETRATQMQSPRYTKQPFLKVNPFVQAAITTKKLRKNIRRGHIWNSLELLNLLRRYVMQIIRCDIINDRDFLGRPDRDIEEVLTGEWMTRLRDTTAGYSASEVAASCLKLLDIVLSLDDVLCNGEERDYRGWILKQIHHERTVLLRLSCDAQP